MEEKVAIYEVTVNGRKDKAISLTALKHWMQEKKLVFSALNIDPDFIGSNETADSFVAKAAINVLAELEYVMDSALGLIKEEPKEEVNNDSKEPESNKIKEDVSKPKEPEVLESKPEQETDLEVPESEKSDEITI